MARAVLATVRVLRPAFALGSVLAAAAVLAPSRAHADVELVASSTVGTLVAPMPDARLDAIELPSRTLADGTRVRTGGQAYAMLGLGADVALVFDRHTTMALLGAEMWLPVGSLDAVRSSADGTVASVQPWRSGRFDISFLGLGVRGVHRRFAGAATLKPGIDIAFAKGELAAGGSTTPFQATMASFLLTAELEGCRRLDPVTRLCVVAAPRLYDFGLLNGAMFGLRWETGP